MSQWSDIIGTVKKVNREVIIIDGDETFVVMNLAKYDELLSKEDILDMNEDEFLNEINRQVAVWKSNNEQNQETAVAASIETADKDEYQTNKNSDDDTFYIEPVE